LREVTITYLEMRSAGELKPKPAPNGNFSVREATVKQWQFNRFMYHFVGAHWSWNDKRNWTEEQWRAYAEGERLRTFTAFQEGSVAGYFEMRPDNLAGIEIAILGLAPPFIGKGFGGALVSKAIEFAWQSQPGRVWLHTCTLDHPAALPNYQARGMRIYKVESIMLR
jgi:GNAT superfamily N-acetyltransferase